jgi:hypothetical protein
MKPHVRREFAISGIKVYADGTHEEGCLAGNGEFSACLGKFSEILLPFEVDDVTGAIAGFMRKIGGIIDWAEKHTNRLYYTGKVANQTILSRLFGYNQAESEFVWTKSRKAKAIKLSNNPNYTKEYIISQLHCTTQDLDDLLNRVNGQTA